MRDARLEEDDVVRRLAAAGRVPAPGSVRAEWEGRVTDVITRAGLTVPTPSWSATGGRSGLHTEQFGYLLAEMQHVHRSHAGATW